MRRILAMGLTVCSLASAALAQGPKGAESLSLEAVADSQKALIALDARVRSNDRDAAAWYRQGMIAWALAIRARAANPPREIDATRMARKADSSLRIAAQSTPANARYQLMTGRFLLTSDIAISRSASAGFFAAALVTARKSGDRALIAETAIEAGRVHWRRYDDVANRRLEINQGVGIRSAREAAYPCIKAIPVCGLPEPFQIVNGSPVPTPPLPIALPLKAIKEDILSGSAPIRGEGDADFDAAAALFREAYAADPANARSVRSVAMVLAEHAQWRDLEMFARLHVKTMPWDAWGWLSLGLASRRLGDNAHAAAAFDSAMALLDLRDRTRLERIDRVLPPSDSARRSSGPTGERAAYQRLYWAMSDPIWSHGGNESHTEYLARVTFAELRWTVDELGVRGADTDRGDIYIRYGPPSFIATFGAQPGGTRDNPFDAISISTVWAYDSGLLFVFNGQPMFATARIARDDENSVQAIRQAQPVRFDNVQVPKIDEMPFQVTRFRGGRDSVDLFLAAQLAVDSIQASAEIRGLARSDLWLLTTSAATVYRDSLIPAANGIRTWTHRVAPAGYLAHIEATAETGTRAARGAGIIDAADNSTTGLPLHGFGVSDLLLATQADVPSGTGKRWTDATLTPALGDIRRGSPLSLVWENYEFGSDQGSAKYQVVVTVTRQQSVAGRIVATIVGALERAARVEHGDNSVTITFERTIPYAPAFVDKIGIALGDTPAGQYTMSLQVTDHVTGRVVTRTQAFTLGN